MAKWTPEEEARLASLYLKVPVEVLIKEFPRHSLSAILAKGNKLVYGNDRTWSPYEVDILVNEYGRLSAKKIRSLYLHHRSVNAITLKAASMGLHRFRDITYNETFFDYWSPELAYTLGLLMTDGSVVRDRSNGCWRVVWMLKVEDSVPLFMMRQLFGGSIVEAGVCYRLTVFGRWIIEKLEALGFDIRRKDKRDRIPDVPPEYLWHFVRGLMDGDGSVRYRKGHGFCIEFTGRQWLVEWLASLWGSKVREAKGRKPQYLNIYRTSLFGERAIKACRRMYDMCGLLFVPRKRNAYLEACRDYSRRGSRGAKELSETGGSPETNRTEDIVQPEEKNSG